MDVFQGLCGGDNSLGKGYKRILQVSVIQEQSWSWLVVWRRTWVLPSDVCTAAWVLLSQKSGCVVHCCGTPKSVSTRMSQQIAPEAQMHWDVINSKKKSIKHTFWSMKKFCLILQSWLKFLFRAFLVLAPCRGPTAELLCSQDAVATGFNI